MVFFSAFLAIDCGKHDAGAPSPSDRRLVAEKKGKFKMGSASQRTCKRPPPSVCGAVAS